MVLGEQVGVGDQARDGRARIARIALDPLLHPPQMEYSALPETPTDGAAVPEDIPLQPLSKPRTSSSSSGKRPRHIRSKPSSSSIKTATTFSDEDEDEADEDEILGLMAERRDPVVRKQRKEGTDQEGDDDDVDDLDDDRPLFVRELDDGDADDAISMVKRVSDAMRERDNVQANTSRILASQIVPESDDPSLPALTFRVVFLGTIRELGPFRRWTSPTF